jgi:hypothetical protein
MESFTEFFSVKNHAVKQENAMNIIFPYKLQGVWVFDDAARGLVAEPFVLGMPEMIDKIFASRGENPDKAQFIFSRHEFPQNDGFLSKENEDVIGSWYSVGRCESGAVKGNGWLCPATLLFFTDYPERIYFKFNAK